MTGWSVELAGIPGSGKSRRARLLADLLAERGIRVHQPQAAFAPSVPTTRRLVRKATASAAVALAAPAPTARMVRALVRSGQPRAADLVGRVVQWQVTQAVAGRSRRDGVAVLDEGHVQALWSVGLRGDLTPVLAQLDARGSTFRARAADLLVVVDVPPEVALARLERRRSRHSRTQRLDRSERLAELQRGAALLDRLAAWWPGRPGTDPEVVRLDGTAGDGADLDRLADRIGAAAAAAPPG